LGRNRASDPVVEAIALMRRLRRKPRGGERLSHAAEDTAPQTYTTLLPVEIAGSVREYLISFEAEVFQYEPGEGCPSAKQ
jgi:hypothetical protein